MLPEKKKAKRASNATMEKRDAFRSIGRSQGYEGRQIATILQKQFMQERALKNIWKDKSRANEIRTK